MTSLPTGPQSPQGPSKRRRGEWRTCPECRGRKWVRPSELTTWRTCSRRCAAAHRSRLVPWNPLQVRILECIADERSTVLAFTTRAGVSDSRIRQWMRNRDTTIAAEAISRIADAVGIPFDQALREAGGLTAKARQREHGAAMATRNFAEAGTADATERARRAGKANKGTTKTEAHVAKVLASRAANGAHDRAIGRLIEGSRSPRGRAAHLLFGRLRHCPAPTTNQLHAWSVEAGAHLDLPSAAVLTLWQPYLRKRGLAPNRGGRPPEIDYPRVHVWRTSSPRVKWVVIGSRLSKDPEVVRTGYARWRRQHPQ